MSHLTSRTTAHDTGSTPDSLSPDTVLNLPDTTTPSSITSIATPDTQYSSPFLRRPLLPKFRRSGSLPFILVTFYRRHVRPNIVPYLLDLLKRILTFIAVLAVIIICLLSLRYMEGLPDPSDYSQLDFDWSINASSYLTPANTSFGQYNVLLDGHSHSVYSDGRMTVDELLRWHIANGYNAVFVTDHNTIDGGLAAEKLALEKYKDQIVVIPGMEYSCCRIHMNFIGINETVPASPPNPTDEDLQNAIAKVHALGGLVIVNHIPWSNSTESGYQVATLPNHPSLESLLSWGVDGFEIINQNTLDWTTWQFTQQHNLIAMTGSDIHYPSVPANAWTVLNTVNMSKEGVLAEVRARRTSFLFDATGTRPRTYPPDNSAYYRLAPLTTAGDYFAGFYGDSKGMYSFQGTFCQPEVFEVYTDMIAWFVVYVLFGIVVYEAARGVVVVAWSAMEKAWRRRRLRRRGVGREEEDEVRGDGTRVVGLGILE